MAGWKIALWVAIMIVALVFLYAVRAILLPFVIAFVISTLLDPTIRKLRLKGFSRGSAVTLVFLSFFILSTSLIIYVTPILTKQFSQFRNRIDFYVIQLSKQSESENIFLNWNPVVQAQEKDFGVFDRLLVENRELLNRLGIPVTKKAIVDQYVEPYRTEIVRAVRSLFTGFISIATGAASQFLFLLLTPLIVFMILMDLERFKSRGVTWIPPAIRDGTIAIITDVGQVFLKYLRGVAITVLFYTAVMSVVLTVVGAPYSILLAILFGTVYLIPYVGSWISAVTLLLVTGLSGINSSWIFSFNSAWVFASTITAIYLICTLIFDQVVYPRMIGKSVGLHPVVSMFVIFCGGMLFGLVGMIIAFPLAGATKIILERIMKITTAEHQDQIALPAVPLRHK